MDMSSSLAPLEVDFLRQYEQNLKAFSDSCGLATDLSMDTAPPKSKCVQVRFTTVCMTVLGMFFAESRPQRIIV